MKFYFFILSFLCISPNAFAQKKSNTSTQAPNPTGNTSKANPSFNRTLALDSKSDTTANVSFGDFDNDGNLDILLVKGRHWRIVDKILLGDGKGAIRKTYNLGETADKSYTGAVADFNGDGSVDIALSNDIPDRKLIYLNDGKGNFKIGSEFGRPQWPTRNISIADINKDGLADIIVANRGRIPTSNFVCFNEGNGKFDSSCIAFAPYPATTITSADLNQDGLIDLVVPHRDGGQSYIYLGGENSSFSDSNRIAFGPADAMIREAAVADFNHDGIADIVTIDERKGIILYYGNKNQRFLASKVLGDPKLIPYALAIADLNQDGNMDVIVGYEQSVSTIFYSNDKGIDSKPLPFGDSQGIVYGFAVGDFNEDGILDIAAARSGAISILYFGSLSGNRYLQVFPFTVE
jgi:hypothetical protein